MKTQLLLLSGLVISLNACATQVKSDQTSSEMVALKSTYLESGLTDRDFDRDLVLGTRLAGLEYCGKTEFETDDIAHLVDGERVEVKISSKDVLQYGRTAALDIYKDYEKTEICEGAHDNALSQTQVKLVENLLPEKHELEKAFLVPGARADYKSKHKNPLYGTNWPLRDVGLPPANSRKSRNGD